MKNKILIAMIFILLVIPIASAAVETLGTFKQGGVIDLVQAGTNFTFCNITSVRHPINNSFILKNVQMTQVGNEYNYTLNSSSTKLLGRYIVNGFCSNGTSDIVWAYDFETTPSGSENMGSGGGLSFIGSLAVMLIIAIVFLIVGFKSEKIAAKVSFFSLSAIGFIMTVLFIVVSAQQNLYGFTGLVSGAETFLFVIQVLAGIGVLALLIIVGLVIKKAWKIKRGYL